jgi:hypothetical protein
MTTHGHGRGMSMSEGVYSHHRRIMATRRLLLVLDRLGVFPRHIRVKWWVDPHMFAIDYVKRMNRKQYYLEIR